MHNEPSAILCITLGLTLLGYVILIVGAAKGWW
jgi:hypothetical protein